MLQPSTLKFLKDLAKNNNKPWFDTNRSRYQDAKADFEIFVGSLLSAFIKFDDSLHHLVAKDCMFRINRDVRFSNDKSPYKTNMAMYASKGGKKAFDCAGYYLHIEPGKCFFAGGIWMPPAPILKTIRQEIDYNFAAFKKILSEKRFANTFGGLSKEGDVLLTRPPKGYEENNPAIAFLKYKSFIASVNFPDEVLTQKDAGKTIAAYGKNLYPFIQYLNHAVADEAGD